MCEMCFWLFNNPLLLVVLMLMYNHMILFFLFNFCVNFSWFTSFWNFFSVTNNTLCALLLELYMFQGFPDMYVSLVIVLFFLFLWLQMAYFMNNLYIKYIYPKNKNKFGDLIKQSKYLDDLINKL